PTAKSRYPLGGHGSRLWTRETAREIRRAIEDQLLEMSDDSVLTVDASGVEVFDFSFASELFGKLVLGVPAEFPGRYVVVTGLSDYLRENLDAALKSIGVMMLEIQSRRRWNLLGKQSPSDRETLVSLNEFGRSVSATELAEEL